MMQKVITFTGGLGAQIISAAGYFYLQKAGIPVSAYLGYFNNEYHLASPGKKGDMSHWFWELDEINISRNSFINYQGDVESDMIMDGPEKGKLGFLGLQDESIRKKFPISDSAKTFIKQMFNLDKFVCVHIRRGDYVNVASHLIADDIFFRALKPITGLVENVLILSDTPISNELMSMLKTLPANIKAATGGSPHLAHGIMRLSNVLLCSNSQLSYTAGALREADKLTFYPSQHDGDLNSYSNTFLRSINEFQLLTKLI